MSETVFYSWQSDLPNPQNRGFIEQALERSVSTLRKDSSLKVDPVLDRDTAGLPGTPDITDSILGKIESAVAIVSDVSIVTAHDATRPSPNPNVLFELGYAVKSRGWERIILIQNVAFGGPECLPFDLRSKLVLTYRVGADPNVDRGAERRRLEGRITEALRLILSAAVPSSSLQTSLVETALTAIGTQNPRRNRSLSVALDDILTRLDAIVPDWSAHRGEEAETLIEAIRASEPVVVDYLMITEALAGAWFPEACVSIARFFSALADRFDPRVTGASYQKEDFDLQKFLAHELFASTAAVLLRDSQWTALGEVLCQPIVIENPWSSQRGPQGFGGLSEYASLLDDRRGSSRARASRYDLLRERHSSGSIGSLVSLDDLADADYLLFLRGELEKPAGSTDRHFRWRPWTWPALWSRTPRFLQEAHSRVVATQLALTLGVSSVEILRQLLGERARRLSELAGADVGHHHLDDFDFDTLGRR